MFYIYILYSKRADKYYVGLTTNPLKRLEEHNNPFVNSKYTAKYIPWEMMMFFRCADTRGEGLLIERFIKNQKSRIFLQKLIAEKENPQYFEKLIVNILKK
jgi:putative endonuclease